MADTALYLVYAVPVMAAAALYLRRRAHREQHAAAVLADTRSAGLHEPASLHPRIDPLKCLGCGSCVRACPEQPQHHVLGLIGGKAALVAPADCIGHGACKAACPTDAITLVFGTETRGVTLPALGADFQTSVPGLYVAGELGGMGLIRNALTQGRQAVEAIHAARRRAPAGGLDLVIVGAGPAGLAAALTAKSLGLRYCVLEQDSLGGSVFQYPRGKVVMTQPAQLPLVGELRIRTTSKEDLLGLWQRIESEHGLEISYRERVEAIEGLPDGGFRIRSTARELRAAQVLLAIGRRGTPRKLGVPGEDLPKVVYRVIDPEQYAGQRVLVVGGGDSALEAALSIAEAGAAEVVLSYRGDAFNRARRRNRERLEEAEAAARVRVLRGSEVRRVERDRVELTAAGQTLVLANDAVIVNAGGVLPTEFLQRIGIAVETKFGTA